MSSLQMCTVQCSGESVPDQQPKVWQRMDGLRLRLAHMAMYPLRINQS